MAENVVFVKCLDDSHKCPICHDVLKHATLTKCGHEFCHDCLLASARGDKLQCPQCRKEVIVRDCFPDKKRDREIQDLIIKCDQSTHGCDWTGELRERKEHNADCGFVQELCSLDCKAKVSRKDVQTHRLESCPRREISCRYCDRKLLYEQLESHHQDSCMQIPDECSYCKKMVARESMETHKGRKGSCPESLLACDFRRAGCGFEGKREALMRHLEDETAQHLSQTVVIIDKQNDILEKLDRDHKKTRKQLTTCRSQLDELQYWAAKTPNWSITHSDDNHFVYLWKLDDWSSKFNSNRKHLSSTFYTAIPGYLLRLAAYLHPSSGDASPYLSIDLQLLKGEFDEHEEWPCTFNVSLSVVNQKNAKGDDIVYSDRPVAKSSVATSSGESLCLCSTANKIPLSTINRQAASFIKNNTVLVKLALLPVDLI
ncbi:TNF receptor-associated factor 6-like [Corticium candelabrum]|uniref:TNF receptor-associated factor 6-like n=1 Tax=Corticium candelabrum TaxID=121492 RepID=UPI002E261FD0|nr:TNF receptor-associated factor 6-like [Corticium candelabrum]